jgi:DNA-directed RNA polymerase specialized sigma24 family protein
MNKDWTLTQEALDRLLAWLDPDRERAGARYEAIRARLIKVFTCRGCHEAEELADETINRVTSRLFDIGERYQGDPALFFYGVAKRVYQEYGGRRFKFTEPLPDSLAAPGSESVEAEYACLEACMEQLPRPQRDLVLRYYRDDKRAKIEGRRKLAESLGIAPNALRIRAHRIRAALHDCVRACLEGRAPA